MTTSLEKAKAQFALGMACVKREHFAEAANHFRLAGKADPAHAYAHNNLGSALVELGKHHEAAQAFERAIQADPNYAQAYYNLGSALAPLGRYDAAAEALQRSLRADPNHAQAYYNLGVVWRFLGRFTDAAGCFLRTVDLVPDHADAYNGLGAVLVEMRCGFEAIQAFDRALAIDPDHLLARAQRMHQLARICAWDRLKSDQQFIPLIGIAGPSVPPFTALTFEDHPQRHRTRSERYAAEYYGAIMPEAVNASPESRPERLKIGYFSADFHDHATMYLAAKLFEVYDRTRFSLYFYSYGADTDDKMRRRLLGSSIKFSDIRTLSVEAAAEAARVDGIDIAIDLKGYTKGHRVGIFAHRAAPIQMTFLGYPGTLGAPFIDYLIADRMVVPDEQRDAFSEKLLYLPHCYQPNDDQRPISDHCPTRAEAGLPDEGFVFCCLNSPYKITPAEFDIWMNLLRRIPASVLWLLDDSDDASANLRLAAQARGVDPDRLIFARKLPQAEHLARLRLAGLFLDTFTCNAHTTASDTLWAGVPLVTKRGKGFAARVAASLLSAIGLDELITTSNEQYAKLAYELATNPARLVSIRAKLASNRHTTPLFDSLLFTRHIEAGFDLAYQRYLEGEAPADILVPAQ